MSACVGRAIPSRASNCSARPAIDCGAKRSTSSFQPPGKTRTRPFDRNPAISTAVRGAGGIGYTNVARDRTLIWFDQRAIILSKFSPKISRASAWLTPSSYNAFD